MTAPLLRPKVQGTARITHRCHHCHRPIDGDPIFTHQAGQLVAVHADCHTKEK